MVKARQMVRLSFQIEYFDQSPLSQMPSERSKVQDTRTGENAITLGRSTSSNI